MGCLSTKDIGDSNVWTSIQQFSREARHSGKQKNKVLELQSAGSKLRGKNKNKRHKTYFEPCLLYVNEPGHSNYHLNDLGLYEQDIEFILNSKKPTHEQKRPKCKGLWEDKSFDETKFNFLESFTLQRPKEIHPNACILVDYIEEREVHGADTECNNFATNVLVLATDDYLLQRVLPDENAKPKKYDGIFHCRLCRFGIWEDIFIDDRLPMGSDGFICGSSSTIEHEMWIPLLEKAYAKFWGDYDGMRSCKFLDVFKSLTGGTGEEIKFAEKRYDPTYIGKRLNAAIGNNSWVVCTVSEKYDGIHSLTGGQVFIVKTTTKEKCIWSMYLYTSVGQKIQRSGQRFWYNRGNNAKATILFKQEADVTIKGFKEVVLVKLRNPVGLTEWTGPWSDKSMEWTTVTSGQKYIHGDGEFYMSVKSVMKYMDSLTICNLVPEQDKLDTEQRSNYITKIYSEWKGKTAAGLNYLKNPKYFVTVSDKGVEDDGKIRIVMILEQLATQGFTELVAIRVKLYKVYAEFKEGVIVGDVNDEGICSRSISVTISYRVVPGKYLIVPHTDREGFEKEFMIAVYTPTPFSGVRLLEHQKPVMVSTQNSTVKIKGVKSKLEHVNYAWGEWNLDRGNLHGEDFHRNPQFEIIIPEGGSSCVIQFQLLKDSFQDEACIGLRLFKLNSSKAMPLNKTWIDAIWDDPVKCHDGSIEGWQMDYIAPTYLLTPGQYVAITWADKPEYKCSFCLIVRVSVSIIINSYNGKQV